MAGAMSKAVASFKSPAASASDPVAITRALGGRRRGGLQGYGLAFCPAHPNTRTPALSVKNGRDGRLLLFCHAGCSFLDVLAALRGMPAPLTRIVPVTHAGPAGDRIDGIDGKAACAGWPEPGTDAWADWQAAMQQADGKLDLIIAKQRNGPVATVRVGCDLPHNHLWDMEDRTS